MDYKLKENDLRHALSMVKKFELEILFLKKLLEDFKFEILGFTKEQEEKENGTL